IGEVDRWARELGRVVAPVATGGGRGVLVHVDALVGFRQSDIDGKSGALLGLQARLTFAEVVRIGLLRLESRVGRRRGVGYDATTLVRGAGAGAEVHRMLDPALVRRHRPRLRLSREPVGGLDDVGGRQRELAVDRIPRVRAVDLDWVGAGLAGVRTLFGTAG